MAHVFRSSADMARTTPEAEGQRRSRYSDVEFSSVYAIPLDAITQSDWVLNGGYQSGVSHTLPGSQHQVCWTDSELCFVQNLDALGLARIHLRCFSSRGSLLTITIVQLNYALKYYLYFYVNISRN